MERARIAISEGVFANFEREFFSTYQPTNEEVRLEQKRRWLKQRENQAG
jgi:queuine tRNA-ribosyltransferase